MHRHDDGYRSRIVPPESRGENPNELGAPAAADGVFRADQVVDAARPWRDRGERGDLFPILRVRIDSESLQQSDRAAAALCNEYLRRFRAIDAAAVHLFEAFGGEVVRPPAGHVRRAKPAPQHRKVRAGERAEGEVAFDLEN